MSRVAEAAPGRGNAGQGEGSVCAVRGLLSEGTEPGFTRNLGSDIPNAIAAGFLFFVAALLTFCFVFFLLVLLDKCALLMHVTPDR